LALDVVQAVKTRLEACEAARPSIRRHGTVVITSSVEEAIGLSNRIAPEHAVCETEAVARRLTHAGTVFVGPYAAQAAGDYCTGSNHVLPTSGAARFRGGLSASDFVRVTSVQRISRPGLRRIAPAVISLANAEGLVAHAASVATRVE
jgi:histidinol dehydrogenase